MASVCPPPANSALGTLTQHVHDALAAQPAHRMPSAWRLIAQGLWDVIHHGPALAHSPPLGARYGLRLQQWYDYKQLSDELMRSFKIEGDSPELRRRAALEYVQRGLSVLRRMRAMETPPESEKGAARQPDSLVAESP